MSAEMTSAMFHLALALAAGPAHGYLLMQEVEALSEGDMRIGPGTLYRSLQRMEVGGLIEQVAAEDSDADLRRRSYALTRAGHEALAEQACRLSVLVRAAAARGVLPAAGNHTREEIP
jgi:DNA-binding PadR family transcriptional regulator